VSLESDVDVLKRQMQSLRRAVQAQGEAIEVLQTPPWKRWFWFVPRGWLPYTVGRWRGN
jgi:hypothetical protein